MSLGKDKYYSAEGGFEEGEALNTQGKYGKYVYNKEELAEICNLDNHHFAGNNSHPMMRLSSQMIMEKYGGPNGIMSALYTNIKVGISSLFLNKYRPVSTTLRMTRRIEPECK